MKSFIFSFLFTLAISLVFIQCSSSPQTEGEQDSTEQEQSSNDDGEMSPQEIAKKQQEMMEKMAEGGAKELVNYEDLKALMPEKIGNHKRVDLSGQSMDMMGMKLSSAEAKYVDDQGNTIEVTINDAGGIPQATAALASWTLINLDRSGDDGFERVATYNGHKSFEKYEKASNRSEFGVFVVNRFLIMMQGRGVKVEDLKKAFDKMDIEGMVKKG